MSVHESEVVQGRIFYLPPEKDLPRHAVRRGHGKGVIEGAYDHPLIIVSRPENEGNVAHFMSLTSFHGKSLELVYKPSDRSKTLGSKTGKELFMDCRRTWFLPIDPSTHPDAVSKKGKKRYPTLSLQDGVTLKKNSYVNIRNIYKVEISHLQSYNACTQIEEGVIYQLTRDSSIQMLAKTRANFKYEPGPQISAGSDEPVSEEEICDAMAEFPKETDPEATEETSMASCSNWDQGTDVSTLAEAEGAVHEDTADSVLGSEALSAPSDAVSQGKGKGKGKKTKWTPLVL